ncbi:MAG: ABC transporter permease subunit [Clostridia bacterium]|nr:ABC transporter permease subunit [Clostridia bacterium]
MNMYLHELRSLRKSAVIWTCSIIAIALLYLSLYPGIAKDAAGFKELLAGYPPAVRAMLGVSLDSITSILGYYSMIITFVVLCGAIQAMNLGVSILSKEARERTADFLLVKPVSRAAIVSAKLLAALTVLLATDVLYYAVAAILASAVKQADYSGRVFFLINLTLLFIQLIFLSLGVAVSVFFHKIKSVLPISLGTVFGFYLIGALIATGKDDGSRFLSPFKYFDYPNIIKNVGYEAHYIITGAAIVVVAIAVTYFIYGRKDIHAVS